MNMNKRRIIKLFIYFIFSFFIINLDAYADTNEFCKSIDTREECDNTLECKWNYGGAKNYCYVDKRVYSSIESGMCSGTTKEVCENAADYCKWKTWCFPNPDYEAIETTKKQTDNSCSSFTKKESCALYSNCKWQDGKCSDMYVANNPCSEKDVLTAINFFGYLLLIAKVAVPLIIIVVGTIDLFKSVIDKDEKSLGKQAKVLLVRIATGIFIFFIPSLIYAIFSLSQELNIISDDKYTGCATCLLDATKCDPDSASNDNTNDNSKREGNTCGEDNYGAWTSTECNKRGGKWNSSQNCCDTQTTTSSAINCNKIFVESVCNGGWTRNKCKWENNKCVDK